MKKVLYSLILLTILIIPGKVFAISGSVNMSCTPTSAYPGDSITCIISGDVSDGSVNEFVATTTLSDNLEFASAAAGPSWTGQSSGGVFSLKSSTSQTDSFEIASFTVKVKSDSTTEGKITLNPTKLGEVSGLGTVTKTIQMSTNITDTSDGKTPTDTEDTTSDTNGDVKNPDTGSSIPFMIIGGGVLFTIMFYQLASKNKKIHKI